MSIITVNDPNPYRRRRGLAATDDLAAPRYQAGINPVHGIPLARPRPDNPILIASRRPASPDSGAIRPFPE